MHGAQIRDQLSALVKSTLLGDTLDQFNEYSENIFKRYLSDFVQLINVASLNDIKIHEKFCGVSK